MAEDVEISVADVAAHRKRLGLRDQLVKHTTKYSVYLRYPQFSLVEWEILQYIREFISTGKMQSEIYAGERYYWFDYKTMLFGLFHTGIRSIRTLRRHIDVLSAKSGDYAPFIKRLVLRRGRECTQMYIAPTAVFDEFFLIDSSEPVVHARTYVAEDVAADETEVITETPTTPYFPDWFPAAWKQFQDSEQFGTLNQFKPSGEPNGYALATAKYMTEILDGTFYSKSGKALKTKHDLTGITLEELVDAVITMADNTRDGLKPDCRLLFARRGQEPISGALNHWARKRKPKTTEPTVLSATEFEALPRPVKRFYGFSTDSGDKTVRCAGLDDAIEQFGSKIFVKQDKRFYQLYKKFESYLENNADQLAGLSGKPIDAGILLGLYRQYLEAQDPEYAATQFTKDLEEIRFGDTTNRNFRAFAIFAYLKHGYYISVTSSFNRWLNDRRHENAQMSNYDIAKLTWRPDERD